MPRKTWPVSRRREEWLGVLGVQGRPTLRAPGRLRGAVNGSVKRAGRRRDVLYLEGMDRVELHFHLLPGVDDGPPDLATALELAREAVRDGTRLVTCTPHAAFVDVAEIPARVRELQAALDEAGVDLEVRAGAELAWDDVPALGAGASSRPIAQGPPGVAGCCSRRRCPARARSTACRTSAQELRDRGFGLLIGHPERSPALTDAPGAVERLLAAGDRLQVNGSSLTGYHGPGARAAAPRARRRRPRGGHRVRRASPDDRAPSLSAAVAVLRRRGTSAAQAEALVSAAPRALLEHGPAAPAPGRVAAQPSTWFSSQSLRNAPRGSRRSARRAKSARRS